jgi:hypothetical protein
MPRDVAVEEQKQKGKMSDLRRTRIQRSEAQERWRGTNRMKEWLESKVHFTTIRSEMGRTEKKPKQTDQ